MKRKEMSEIKNADSTAFPIAPRSLYKNDHEIADGKMEEWNPFKELEGFFKEMNTLFERVSNQLSDIAVHPKTDVYQTDDNVVVKAEIPGLSKDNLDVDVYENHIRLSGKKQRSNEYRNTDRNMYRKEECYNAFFRTLSLPVKVKYQQAKIEYKGDILSITIPKAESQN